MFLIIMLKTPQLDYNRRVIALRVNVMSEQGALCAAICNIEYFQFLKLNKQKYILVIMAKSCYYCSKWVHFLSEKDIFDTCEYLEILILKLTNHSILAKKSWLKKVMLHFLLIFRFHKENQITHSF